MKLNELFSEAYTPTKDRADYDAKKKALQDIQMDPNTAKDPELKKELIRRKAALEKDKEKMESATAGATSSGSIATVVSPHLAIGKDRGNRSYTGSPGKSGTKAPKLPKITQKKKADGTAVNALDIKGNIFGGGAALKR
jgi:hypothetical protein